MRGASWFWPAVEAEAEAAAAAAAVAVVVRLTLVFCKSSLRTLPQCAYATLAHPDASIAQANSSILKQKKQLAVQINETRGGGG